MQGLKACRQHMAARFAMERLELLDGNGRRLLASLDEVGQPIDLRPAAPVSSCDATILAPAHVPALTRGMRILPTLGSACVHRERR
jgi:hypothetical protein